MSEEEKTTFVDYCKASPLMLFFIASGTCLAGNVVSICWGWFIVPLGLPAITWVHGAGIDLLVTLIATGGPGALHPDIKEEKRAKNFLLSIYLRPIIALAISWVLHLMMVAQS